MSTRQISAADRHRSQQRDLRHHGIAAASGGSGTGLLSFSAGASTGCAVLGTTVSMSNARHGTCALTATKDGDNNYTPRQVRRSRDLW
jgi:hypothetical protein